LSDGVPRRVRPSLAAPRRVPPDRAATRGLLVLDFDGTLWRGNEALEFYAAAVADGLVPAQRGPFLGAVRMYLAGGRWSVVGASTPPDDGWAAVARFAADRGLDPVRREEAFLATRAQITAGAFRLEVPDGLEEFLHWSRRWCTLVLASNSPAWSVHPVLERLGLAPLLDDVVCEASKPDSFVGLVTAWADRFGAPPGRIMSVGDHYRNDIAPAVAAGWFTAHITPWRWAPGPCSMIGATMEELLPGLHEWVEAIAGGEGPVTAGKE